MLLRAPASAEMLPSAPFSAPTREPIAAKFGWKKISVPLFPRYIHDVCVVRVLLVSNEAFEMLSYRLAVTSISTSLPGVE
jgi:hypothetical protein